MQIYALEAEAAKVKRTTLRKVIQNAGSEERTDVC